MIAREGRKKVKYTFERNGGGTMGRTNDAAVPSERDPRETKSQGSDERASISALFAALTD